MRAKLNDHINNYKLDERMLGFDAMNRRRFLGQATAAAGAGLVHAQFAGGQRAAVRVTREEPVIERIEFDPRWPPPGMPQLTPPESGVCKTTFELSASVRYSAERLSATTARLYVEGLDIVTRLRFDIYTVLGGPAKLRAHEEAHRAIGEHFYRNAAQIAEDIGRRLIGATFDGSGSDEDAAQRDGFQRVVATIEGAYMARVRIPSGAANERFDEITNHGVNPIGEAEAIALALEGPAGG
jgi:hypothetical protein